MTELIGLQCGQFPPYLIDDVARIEIDREDNIWLTCWKHPLENGFGLTKFDDTSWTTYNIYNSPISSNRINDITLDIHGNLWLCTSGCSDCENKGGLVKYDRNESWVIYNQVNSGIAFNTQSTIKIDSFDNKWIGHIKSGLTIFKENGVIITDIVNSKIETNLTSYSLSQNYPNPFNPTTTIEYSIPSNGTSIRLTIFDMLGREVITLVKQEQRSGVYKLNWDANKMASGIYYYQLKVGDFTTSKKMLLLK